jgi:hypothetical protein
VTRRIAIALLAQPRFTPVGVSGREWRLALAEDVIDVLATLAEVDAAVAVPSAEAHLARQVGWPGLRSYAVPVLDIPSVLAAAADDGYEQAALLAADAPDLPGLTIAKLLRPLTTRPVSAAPDLSSAAGLLGLAARLPAPAWLPATTLDTPTPQSLRTLSPQVTDVAPAAGWHRLGRAEDLSRLDPRLEGWAATRSLLASVAEHQDPHNW